MDARKLVIALVTPVALATLTTACLRTLDTSDTLASGDGGVSMDATVGDGASAGGDATPDGSATVATQCPVPGLGGGPMSVAHSSAGTAVCVDNTEVTQAQYYQFLTDTNGGANGQDPRCAANTSFMPSCSWSHQETPDYPVVCVDWCDAVAYCTHVGKQLCGAIGANDTLSGDSADFLDANRSQWSAACTNGVVQAYPYGTAYDSKACNLLESGPNHIANVGSWPACHGEPPAGANVSDMVGNVEEWEDACSTTNGVLTCTSRGGGFDCRDAADAGAPITSKTCSCNIGFPRAATTAAPMVGFRCCARPTTP